MASNAHRFGLVLFFSLAAGLFSLSVLSWADDADDSPQWCTRAKTKVEKLICGEYGQGQVGAYDQELGVYYESLLKMVEPSAKSDLVQSQKKWIAERERCAAAFKKAEDLQDLRQCVVGEIYQRSDFLQKGIAERQNEKRWSEFNKFGLRTFKNTAFEFQYPNSWHLEKAEDGRISLKSQGDEMILGFEKTAIFHGFETTVTSSKQCTYTEGDDPEDETRRNFYEGKKEIGGREFEHFRRGYVPSGREQHYYAFFNGRCFAIDVTDNSDGGRHCGLMDVGKDSANCEIAVLEEKDLMAYSDAVMRTVHFLSKRE
jgi:uncharacterized protein YecT (DUF1311 family)